MEQELHTAFCPLHSLHRGGGLIQGHLFFLPALRHLTSPLQLLLLMPKQLGSSTGWSYPCTNCGSYLHFICSALRGGDREGENLCSKPLHVFSKHLRRFFFLPELPHSTHKTILFRARRWLLTGRICIAWGHQSQDQAVQTCPFLTLHQETQGKGEPLLSPLCFPPLHEDFPMQKSTASSIPRCQQISFLH